MGRIEIAGRAFRSALATGLMAVRRSYPKIAHGFACVGSLAGYLTKAPSPSERLVFEIVVPAGKHPNTYLIACAEVSELGEPRESGGLWRVLCREVLGHLGSGRISNQRARVLPIPSFAVGNTTYAYFHF